MSGKPQTTRLIKCECEECGYVVRTTRKWLEIAEPICPNEECDHHQMAMQTEQPK